MNLKQEVNRENKTKTWFFEKINTIDKPAFRLTKKIRETT